MRRLKPFPQRSIAKSLKHFISRNNKAEFVLKSDQPITCIDFQCLVNKKIIKANLFQPSHPALPNVSRQSCRSRQKLRKSINGREIFTQEISLAGYDSKICALGGSFLLKHVCQQKAAHMNYKNALVEHLEESSGIIQKLPVDGASC